MASIITHKKFPIIGVGASAGGIVSFQKFLKAIPVNSGMAYILVQHLSPTHDSILPEILSKVTLIPVNEILNDCQIEPNNIYVIPENQMLEVIDYSLRLKPRKKEGINMPIDVFFSSLARVHGPLAVGVVLSGTASDGTLGLRDIKDQDGITFAEDPKTAAWDGMPKNAIDSGVVDFVLPVEEIPAKIINIHSLSGTNAITANSEKNKMGANGLKEILSVVQQHSGVDFSYYKEPTILRRIDRRIAINQIEAHRDYLGFLSESRIEQEALFHDLLIKVTSFFRDPEVFDELSESVFSKLLENRTDPIRIWVAACATGEEVYSLAISLLDKLGGLQGGGDLNRAKIQIFATDISEAAIKKARDGVYSNSEVEPLSKKQLDTYFTKIDGNYKVLKSLRDNIVFATHNFLQDPPFGNLAMVSCRNVLIYLDPILQKKALTTFHYALREDGFLLLGRSESTGTTSDLFVPLSKSGKIYSRKSGPGRFVHVSSKQNKNSLNSNMGAIPSLKTAKKDFRKSAESILISKYTPVSVIVDEHMEVVHINGSVVPFLEPSIGKPSHELMKMVRKELAFELRSALHKAKASQKSVIKEGIPLNHNGEQFLATIEIIPLIDTVDPHFLILFQNKSAATSFLARTWKKLKPSFTMSAKNHVHQQNVALENELKQTREDMRRITEEQEAYNEELQSTNEEMQSTNEEMQSLNEELETSKEELQSTNEELIITNRELLEKQEEQNHTLYLLDGVIATLREPFVVLQKDFRIQIASTAFYKKFDVEEGEIVGKSIFEIQKCLWENTELRSLLEKILPKKERIVDEEINIKYPSDIVRSFMFNSRQIKREKDADKLILLSMEDITERKKTQGYKDVIAELTKTNRQLDRYVYVASHDLQEPLRKIMIFSDRMIERGESRSAEDIEILEKIISSAERMSGLIKGLLEYSSLTHYGGMFEITDINDIMKDIISDYEVVIEEKGVQFEIGELPVLECLPVQINQLLTNLIGNAIKFTKPNVTPLIQVSSRALTAEEVKKYPSLSPELSYQEIIVNDNGIGFDQKYGEQIFVIFQRLRQSLEHRGTGIGLSLVKKIADNHNGEVYAVSKIGGGASFHLILPIKQSQSPI
ncbi:ATP-binding protein [Flavobacteriaceae bacterium KMM 6898]|nr:ATP-binding protein [Flavobacteriaceae bacterium KMM 6898]